MLALKYAPTHVTRVTVPAGTSVRVGIVGGHKQWGPGGAIQFEVLEKPALTWFTPWRPLRSQ
jgi:hypothetical protein